MEFWVLFFIGLLLVGVARIIMATKNIEDCGYDVEDFCKPFQVFMHVLASICIVTVGGIAVAKFLSFIFPLSENIPFWGYILAGIIPAFLTYLVGFWALGLYTFGRLISQIFFIIIFVVSIIIWTLTICNYNNSIETVSETKVVATEKHQILSFPDIQVQNVSGNISGTLILGTGKISGSIITSGEFPYWYYDEENNKSVPTSTPANVSEVCIIPEEEHPYVVVTYYQTYTTTINHISGIEKTNIDKEWEESTFYLPPSVFQFPPE